MMRGRKAATAAGLGGWVVDDRTGSRRDPDGEHERVLDGPRVGGVRRDHRIELTGARRSDPWIGAAQIDGVTLAATRRGAVLAWPDLDREPVRANLPADQYERFEAHSRASIAIAVGRDGSYAVRWRDGALRFERLEAIDGHPVVSLDRAGRVHAAIDGADVLVRISGELQRLSSAGDVLTSRPFVSPDGRWLAAIGLESLLVWDLSGDSLPIRLHVGEPPTALAWHSESGRVALATLDSVRVVELRAEDAIESGCRLIDPPHLRANERDRYVPGGVAVVDACAAREAP